MNLTCSTNTAAANGTQARSYHVSLRCAWLGGAGAPEDTQYFLRYRYGGRRRHRGQGPSSRLTARPVARRYGARTEECRWYSQDSRRRNTACWFPRTVIDGKGRDWLAVQVRGSSARAAIRPYDRLFALHAIGETDTGRAQPGRGVTVPWFDSFPPPFG